MDWLLELSQLCSSSCFRTPTAGLHSLLLWLLGMCISVHRVNKGTDHLFCVKCLAQILLFEIILIKSSAGHRTLPQQTAICISFITYSLLSTVSVVHLWSVEVGWKHLMQQVLPRTTDVKWIKWKKVPRLTFSPGSLLLKRSVQYMFLQGVKNSRETHFP